MLVTKVFSFVDWKTLGTLSNLNWIVYIECALIDHLWLLSKEEVDPLSIILGVQ